ncbi:MAG TPA: hypothetical protein VM864_09050 [Pyrinomonadaceae bacterium]|jgi:hypothetical protein|nr:hypothetical protein [Pyrinomonadaceae bacterium]
MKVNLFLLGAAALLISDSGAAQKTDLARVPSKRVTLISQRQKTYGKSVFNFEYGLRGDDKFPRQPSVDELPGVRSVDELNRLPGDAELPRAPGRAAPTQRRQRYDIRYGGASLNGDDNWLDVAERRGARSMIKDLGEMQWSEVSLVPILPASPYPHDGSLSYSFRRGVAKISPEGVVVRAAVGHMYVVHVKDQEADYYVMFRVEAIEPKGECTLSWKRVPSPER